MILKPCPFCGDDSHLTLDSTVDGQALFSMTCGNCLASGPADPIPQIASDAWQDRPAAGLELYELSDLSERGVSHGAA